MKEPWFEDIEPLKRRDQTAQQEHCRLIGDMEAHICLV